MYSAVAGIVLQYFFSAKLNVSRSLIEALIRARSDLQTRITGNTEIEKKPMRSFNTSIKFFPLWIVQQKK